MHQLPATLLDVHLYRALTFLGSKLLFMLASTSKFLAEGPQAST